MTTVSADNDDMSARSWRIPAAVALLAAILLAYANSFSVPLLLDDGPTITENESIRDLRRIGTVLSSGSVFTQGRPVLNLSFALNHAIGGTRVAGYHVANVGIHFLCALLLWGILRRTLRLANFRAHRGIRVEWVAWIAALIWGLHPVQVGSVTYLSQRAESLMALFYLLALYGLIRGGRTSRWSWWHGLAIASCAIGMGVKEVMVTAPVACLLYDVVFLSGSVRAAWQQRWRCHLGLAACWIVLAALMLATQFETRVVHAGTPMPAEPYGITAVRALARYLQLMVWPHPLIFDYGIDQAVFAQFNLAWSVAVVAAFLAIGAVAWRRSRAVGFAFLWILLLLAPTTSFVPVAGQRIAENRIYLPLIAVAALLPVIAATFLPRRGATFPLISVVIALGVLTWRRNADFRSPVALWQDTIAKLPASHRAHAWLGLALLEVPGKYEDAMRHLTEASRLAPWDLDTYWNLGLGLVRDSRRPLEAARCFEVVVQAKPEDASAHAMLGTALLMSGTRREDAARHLETAVRLRPDRGDFHRLWGAALLNLPGRRADAIRELEQATRLSPADFEAFTNLGLAFLSPPAEPDRAIAAQRAAVRLNPRSPIAWCNLGVALLVRGEASEAEKALTRALELNPGFEPAQTRLRELRARPGSGR